MKMTLKAEAMVALQEEELKGNDILYVVKDKNWNRFVYLSDWGDNVRLSSFFARGTTDLETADDIIEETKKNWPDVRPKPKLEVVKYVRVGTVGSTKW